MQKLTATFRIVTPMFIAGADQDKAELRTPSIKGVLRLWWRALNWSRFCLDDGALKAMQAAESSLFGDACDEGQSKLLIKTDRLTGTLSGNGLLNGNASLKYLGYGLFTMGEHRPRMAIPANKKFTLELLLKDSASERVDEVKACIQTLGLLGGLGSRSRNGFGSVALEKINDKSFQFDSLENYRKAIDCLVKTTNQDDPPFSAFSNQTKVIFGPMKTRSEDAHQHIGALYQSFRTRHQHEPAKRFLGLPLDGYDTDNRRASPLIFHIHPVGEKFIPVILKMPGKFHPDYDKSRVDYSLVNQFIDKFKNDGGTEL